MSFMSLSGLTETVQVGFDFLFFGKIASDSDSHISLCLLSGHLMLYSLIVASFL